ncbi:hypothetical protein BpHYR1_002389 [Brachionus plicatilis]|uniref:Uncharacterized protein n=1 Tax=Brachionus plicatilis TaxID=10195 RepID=A0A3M7QH52_BRAPC|nr:hypothetical protein BpHYR1_002389 [Brachionus plicatilis]
MIYFCIQPNKNKEIFINYSISFYLSNFRLNSKSGIYIYNLDHPLQEEMSHSNSGSVSLIIPTLGKKFKQINTTGLFVLPDGFLKPIFKHNDHLNFLQLKNLPDYLKLAIIGSLFKNKAISKFIHFLTN